MPILVKLESVSKVYADTSAVKAVNFTVHDGEFTALAGPSGSGKTSLLNLISGLDHPTHGHVQVLGHYLAELSADQLAWLRRSKMGFVFQAYNLLPVLTALENVEYPLALLNLPADQRRERALDALEAVGLKKYARRRPSELSGGQQQRVAVARAITTSPALVLADEPTANLDSKSATSLVDLFRELNEDRHITFLFSSHDQRVLQSARRVLEIADGAVKGDSQRAIPLPKHNSPRTGVGLAPSRRGTLERLL